MLPYPSTCPQSSVLWVRTITRRHPPRGETFAAARTYHEPAIRPSPISSNRRRRSGSGGASLLGLGRQGERRFPWPHYPSKGPVNLEFPFPSLDSLSPPTEQFYVRTHFEVPEIGGEIWSLKVEGEVERPFEYRSTSCGGCLQAVTALLECSGNGRVFLEPPPGRHPLGTGRRRQRRVDRRAARFAVWPGGRQAEGRGGDPRRGRRWRVQGAEPRRRRARFRTPAACRWPRRRPPKRCSPGR